MSEYCKTLENYIYFVNLDDFYVCANLANSGQISSPAFIHEITCNSLHPIYTKSVEELWNDTTPFNTYTSPRLTTLTMSKLARQGMILGIGLENTKFFSTDEINRIHTMAKIEVEFEKIRRHINSKLPSRLVSLFIAENNYDGRTMLKNMFQNKKDFVIAQVKINFSTRYHRADSQWFDEFHKTQNIEAIYNYWKGVDYNSIPLYEFLVDGQIELKDNDDMLKISKENKRRHG